MKPKSIFSKSRRSVLAVLCAIAINPPDAFAQDTAPPIPADQLDSLVAPIALYPDPLVAQTLAASTYPLEIMQLQQWLARNPGLQGKALADAAAQQPWDASVQAMAGLPDVVKRLADDIQWTTDLGNAFLAQQADVMEAVQRMRGKAQDKGTLSSGAQQVVETKVVENESVIVIEQANPEVVYVPSYDPVAVYGPAVYPYPPIYYPPAEYYAAGMAISWGVGVAMGAFWGNGGWGWGPRWGDNDITINNNNNFIRNANVRSGYRGGTVSNTWQHRPEHRGGAPYRDRATANRYGGTARGESLSNRQSQARQQVNRQGGNLPSAQGVGTSGTSTRAGAAQQRQAGGDARDRAGASGIDNRAARSSSSGRAPSASVGDRAATRGTDYIGQRDMSRSGSGDRDAFGGGYQKYSGSSARADSHRGSSSMQSRGGSRSHGGGGRSRGGGGRR